MDRPDAEFEEFAREARPRLLRALAGCRGGEVASHGVVEVRV